MGCQLFACVLFFPKRSERCAAVLPRSIVQERDGKEQCWNFDVDVEAFSRKFDVEINIQQDMPSVCLEKDVRWKGWSIRNTNGIPWEIRRCHQAVTPYTSNLWQYLGKHDKQKLQHKRVNTCLSDQIVHFTKSPNQKQKLGIELSEWPTFYQDFATDGWYGAFRAVIPEYLQSSSIVRWDFPWNKPTILGYQPFISIYGNPHV